jgi:hypothetical protein
VQCRAIERTGIQLIAVPYPMETAFWEVVQRREVIVACVVSEGSRRGLQQRTWNTVDRADSDFMKASEQVFSYVDWIA